MIGALGRARPRGCVDLDRCVVVELEAFRYDAQTQRLETTLIHLSTEGVQLIPANHCYAGPADIDVMAQAAGFELDARWRDWEEGAFTDTSERHISVYRRTA